MKKIESNKAITLVALVITIIVLLILAGVTINVIIGDNGIISKARDAKNKTENVSIEEEIELAISASKIDFYANDGIITASTLNEYTDKGEFSDVVVENGNISSGKFLLYLTNETYNFSFENGKVTISENTNCHLVFHDYDGNIIEEKDVKKGTDAQCSIDMSTPIILEIELFGNESYYAVFYGWQEDKRELITSPSGEDYTIINNVQHDMNLYPMYYVSEPVGDACFVAETKVLTQEGLINIEEVKAGMKVWSYNIETGKIELKTVLSTSEREVEKDLCRVYVGNEVIESTSGHEYYELNKGWTPAKDLNINDNLLKVNKENITITNVEVDENVGTTTVYNLRVEGNHNYFVSNECILVHNATGPVC